MNSRKALKLAGLAAVQKLQAAIQADEALAAKLEAELAKKRADQRRRDDSHAKIILGAGMIMLSTNSFARTMGQVTALLTKRDRLWIENWCLNRGLKFTVTETEEQHNITHESASASTEGDAKPHMEANRDLVGQVLKRAIAKINVGEFALFAPVILEGADEADQRVLNAWFASRLDNSGTS